MAETLALLGGKPAITNFEGRKWPFYSPETETAIVECMRAGQVYVSQIDPLIESVEHRFVEVCCPETLGLFCSSGTAALFAAYFPLVLIMEQRCLFQQIQSVLL